MLERDPQSLSRLLLYGSPQTRRQLAESMVSDGDLTVCSLLAETVRSPESWLLRARCLEVLGLAAGGADQETAEQILGTLIGDATERTSEATNDPRPADGGQ